VKRLASLTLVAVAITVGILATSATSGLRAETLTLGGHITQPNGNAVADVVVTVERADGTVAGSDVTDAGGAYEVAIDTPGTYDVRFEPPAPTGLSPRTVDDFEILGSSTLDMVLVPATPVTFSGVVREADGDPAAGISIGLCDETGNYRSQTTGADGRFEFQRAPGNYCWRIRGGANNSTDLPTGLNLQGPTLDLNNSRDVDLTIPLVPVTIHVQDPNGQPIADARANLHTSASGNPPVEVAPGITMTGPNAEDSALTDTQGNAQLALFNTNQATGSVTPPPNSAYTNVAIPPHPINGPTTITATLVAPVTFSGVVREADGDPAAGISIGLCDETGNYRSQTTGADGRFEFQRAPGNYCWRIRGGANNSTDLPTGLNLQGPTLDLNNSRDVDLTIPLVPVTIHVQDPNGQPIADARANLHTSASGNPPVEVAPGITMTGPNAEDSALTDTQGNAQLALFNTNQATGSVTPPPNSAYTNVAIPPHPINGPTTIVVAFIDESVPDDIVPPTIDLQAPEDGASYAHGQVVAAGYSCADEPGGSGLASCVGTLPSGGALDTSTAGSFSFSVTATDDAGNTASRTVTYTVRPSAEELIADLIADLEAAGLPNGLENGLTNKVEQALAQLANGNVANACQRLVAFADQVEAQSGRRIPVATADALIAAAHEIRAELGCTAALGAIGSLADEVAGAGLANAIEQSLTGKLSQAVTQIEDGDNPRACNRLEAFRAQVERQAGRKVPAAKAAEWTGSAQGIRAHMGCEGT
jgi:5-hydroxyisourate hydrolase-like protein (transthyretin family)